MERPHIFQPLFQHTAARRRLVSVLLQPLSLVLFQHTAARRRLVGRHSFSWSPICVSTHSRPKAAGFVFGYSRLKVVCFNTQPPEGGWTSIPRFMIFCLMFQHTAARRRLARPDLVPNSPQAFQHTAARRRLGVIKSEESATAQFQHTAARRRLGANQKRASNRQTVSTHSRPKAAG